MIGLSHSGWRGTVGKIGQKTVEKMCSTYGCRTKDIIAAIGHGKYQLDLWQANALVLGDAGIRKENIALPDICTCCNFNTMWSHRKIGAKRGSLAAFLMLPGIRKDYNQ